MERVWSNPISDGLYRTYSHLHNDQIDACALIGQSAMVYCAGKMHGKIARLLKYYTKAIDHKFLWLIG